MTSRLMLTLSRITSFYGKTDENRLRMIQPAAKTSKKQPYNLQVMSLHYYSHFCFSLVIKPVLLAYCITNDALMIPTIVLTVI